MQMQTALEILSDVRVPVSDEDVALAQNQPPGVPEIRQRTKVMICLLASC